MDRKTKTSKERKKRKTNDMEAKPKDGQTWVEILMVVDRKKRRTRQMFFSLNTGKYVWDKPPSNASYIFLADRSIFPDEFKPIDNSWVQNKDYSRQ